MRYVAAALLASLAGESVDKKTIKSILDSVGIEADAEKMDKVIAELKGKDVNELIAEGLEKLASVPSGAGAAAPAAAAGAADSGSGGDAKKEEKKEESEEEDDDMGFGLFD